MAAARLLLLLLASLGVALAARHPLVDASLRQARRTLITMAPPHYPDHTAMNVPPSHLNTWLPTAPSGWTSAFFPGLLWYLFKATGDAEIRDAAVTWTEGLKSQEDDTSSHDIGFKIYDSFGKGLELDTSVAGEFTAVLVRAARSLATRFSPMTGLIQSWNAGHHCKLHPNLNVEFPVIIDNMMNLELLFAAGNLPQGDPNWVKMAVSHADHTAMNHVRADGSCYHVVGYNPHNGSVALRCTAQGYADESAWSRGQAWCIHGFTMAFRFTRFPKYLQTAKRCAEFFLKNLPADSVPLWDFQWPGAVEPSTRDSSAAAVAASGLAELSTLLETSEPRSAKRYRRAAVAMLDSLASPAYLGVFEETQGVLMHATANFGNGTGTPGLRDTALGYGDFFALEATVRLRLY